MKRARAGVEGGETVDATVNIAQVLMLLSSGAGGVADYHIEAHQPPRRVFECKTCNRQFFSFQALGGHRASHKKPKLLDDQSLGGPGRPLSTKPRVHECSICGLEFALGQALGGHMRRHRVTVDGFATTHGHGQGGGGGGEDGGKKGGGGGGEKRVLAALDLNLTPMENDAELRLLTFSLGLPLVH